MAVGYFGGIIPFMEKQAIILSEAKPKNVACYE